jgi:hypothetical protein
VLTLAVCQTLFSLTPSIKSGSEEAGLQDYRVCENTLAIFIDWIKLVMRVAIRRIIIIRLGCAGVAFLTKILF